MKSFREASKGYGKYCPIKNELRVRRGRKLYRFTCGEHELRFAAPGREEIVIYFASNVKPIEFKRCIASLIESQ